MRTFALASRDENPLHVDSAFARRSPFGGCVVHGCLLAIGMLACISEQELQAATGLELSFSSPLPVGAEATASVTRAGVVLTGRGRQLARVRLASAEAPDPPYLDALGRPEPTSPRDRPATGLDRAPRGVAYPPSSDLRELAFQLGAGAVPDWMLHGLGWASYVAGMEAPGLHCLLAGVTLTRISGEGGDVEAGVLVIRDVDERTGRVLVGSVLYGEGSRIAVDIEAFLLEPPRMPDVDALRPADATPRHDGAAVVVGASRGLGAAMALAFAFRGCDVHAVYSSSRAAAEEVVTLAGDDAHRFVLHQADAGDGPALDEIAHAVEARGRRLDALVLAAAPPPVQTALAGDGASYLSDYVAASLAVVAVPLAALLPLLAADGTVVFCSSTAVAEPPRDWPHYVAAKGAIEALATWLSTTHPGLSIVVVRLPKLSTDMTNTPAGRMGATAPEPIAKRLVEAALAHAFDPGIVILDPADAAVR